MKYISGGLPPARLLRRRCGPKVRNPPLGVQGGKTTAGCIAVGYSGPPVRAGFSKKNGSPGGVNPFPLRGKWLRSSRCGGHNKGEVPEEIYFFCGAQSYLRIPTDNTLPM